MSFITAGQRTSGVDLNSTQTLQNKTLNNTNTITVKDANLTIQDNADTTKQAKFEASGITTGTTRTLTVPNASGTLGFIIDSQFFTADGTWTKPAGVTATSMTYVKVQAAGGGGGSGRRGTAGNAAGGGGAASGGYSEAWFRTADLPATVAATVGQGGVGGAAVTTDNTNGNDGAKGGDSSFGTYVLAIGGEKANGGDAMSGNQGNATTVNSQFIGSSGGMGTTVNGIDSVDASYGAPSGGAGGGGIGFAATGGSAGRTFGYNNNDFTNGGTVAGQAGTNGTSFPSYGPGTGGGGGAGSDTPATVNGGDGGNGGNYGAGGGGGGAAENGFNSGKGGNGGGGYVEVITFL